MYSEFRNIFDFQMVYVKEAHPEDEWWTSENRTEGILFNQPKTLPQRLDLAGIFQEQVHLKMPLLVDPIDDSAGNTFAAWPERVYVIDTAGRIVFKGGMGPFDFDPEQVRQFLELE